MEQVVLKLQNLLRELGLLADSPPAQGRPSISDLMTNAYETDPVPGKILEAIHTNGSMKDITIAECTEHDGIILYRGKYYVPESDQLWLWLMQEHHDTALAGHPGRAKRLDLLDRQYYWKDMRKHVDQFVWNCHNCQRSQSSRHSTFGVLRTLTVPVKALEDISIDFVVGLPECERLMRFGW